MKTKTKTTRAGQDERYVPLAVALPGRRASTETFTRALNAAVLVAVTANILRSVRDCEWRMRRVGETPLNEMEIVTIRIVRYIDLCIVFGM